MGTCPPASMTIVRSALGFGYTRISTVICAATIAGPRSRATDRAKEALALDVREIFVTGGEPLLLPDIGEILAGPSRLCLPQANPGCTSTTRPSQGERAS